MRRAILVECGHAPEVLMIDKFLSDIDTLAIGEAEIAYTLTEAAARCTL